MVVAKNTLKYVLRLAVQKHIFGQKGQAAPVEIAGVLKIAARGSSSGGATRPIAARHRDAADAGAHGAYGADARFQLLAHTVNKAILEPSVGGLGGAKGELATRAASKHTREGSLT